MEYFYHYTSIKNWKKIQQEGLRPSRSIGGSTKNDAPDLAHKLAIFGLPSPAPENWRSYKVDVGEPGAPLVMPILTYLLAEVSGEVLNSREVYNDIILMKVRIQPDDDVRVGDYKSIWEAFSAPSGWDAAAEKYCQSVTSLKDKFNVAASMTLPEVLCFNPIPADRIEFAEKIPAKTIEEICAYVERKRESDKRTAKATTPSLPVTSATRPKRSVP